MTEHVIDYLRAQHGLMISEVEAERIIALLPIGGQVEVRGRDAHTGLRATLTIDLASLR